MYNVTEFLREIFFPGGYPTKLQNYGNSRSWEGMTSTPLELKFQGVGGLK